MSDTSHLEDNISMKSGSLGGRSPPSLSPVVTIPTTTSPTSPPPPLLAAPPLSVTGPSPPVIHSPNVFPSPPPSSRPPPFLPSLYFTHAYASPPPIHTSDPTANDCKLVDFRGQKIAAFIIAGDTMLCLPQAFELFLKNLVGGLHTVYTKLKRLGIEPLVCNVEQVRVLRGLGAIQPGVNRCKLLSLKHFEILYKDCTTARPGRPPKRPHEILGLGLTSPLGGPGSLPPHHLSPEALMALKKSRLDGRDFAPFMNGVNSHPGENGELEKSPLLSNGYNPPPKTLMAQYMALNGGMPHPALLAHSGLPLPPHPTPWGQHPQDHPFKNNHHQENLARSMVWENCRASYDEVLKHLERIREDRTRADRMLGLERDERDDGLDRSVSPHPKTNGYGESDVLNLSSKSDSREDLSDAGTPPPSLCNSMLPQPPLSHSPEPMDKDEPLSDNDFDDKHVKDGNKEMNALWRDCSLVHNQNLSDREDYGYAERSLHVALNNNNNNNTTISTNNNLLGLGASSNSSNSSSCGSSTEGVQPTTTSTAGERIDPDRIPAGLTLGGGLMSLGVGVNDMAAINGGDHQALNPGNPGNHPPLSSLENLLGNIQNLLKVAAESVRHEEKQWYKEKEHLRLEFIRQKEMRERLEKQLVEDEKLKLLYLRKLKREKRARRRLEEELTEKLKRLSQYEPNAKEILRAAESLAKEGVKKAAMAAAVAAVGGSGSGNQPNDTPHVSPKPQHPSDMECRSPVSTQPETPALYFNKSILFNCTV